MRVGGIKFRLSQHGNLSLWHRATVPGKAEMCHLMASA
jgi:hypothetical protein